MKFKRISNKFEKFLYKKISLWILILILIFGLIFVILFSSVVRHAAQGGIKTGFLGELALEISEIPSHLKKIISGPSLDLEVRENRFSNLTGLIISDKGIHVKREKSDLEGYLLLARYDGDLKRSVVELIDIDKNTILHSWKPNIKKINSLSKFATMGDKTYVFIERDHSPERYRMIHPLLDENELIFLSHSSPLVKVDECSNVKWTSDFIFHHSIEKSYDNTYWVSEWIRPPSVKLEKYYRDESVTQISNDGKILFRKSLMRIFLDNNMFNKIDGYNLNSITKDPFHINDIQPVLFDGPYWKKGDLFLSIRSTSMILLYRPKTNKIIFYKIGPWEHQHDVDILNDHQISIFNNKFSGANNTIVYDFKKDTTKVMYKEAFKKLKVRTREEGLHQLLKNDDIFVEETLYGRALRFDKKGNIKWQFINRAKNGKLYHMNWSRFLDETKYSKTVSNLIKAKCQ